MKSTTLLPLTCLALLLSLGACDSSPSNGPSDDQPGSFSATVTGDVTATVSGVATSTGSSGTGGWGIALAPGGSQSITIVTPGRSRPAPGIFPILTGVQAMSASGTPFFASFVAALGTPSFGSTLGTLTITSSSSTLVVGSFSFEAQRGTVGNPEIVTVQGTFTTQNFPPAGM